SVLALALGLVLACGDDSTSPPSHPGRPTVPPTYHASGHALAGDAFVHLFEWRWNDIANECETVLAPAGYTAVQVSPPQEHSITPDHDWSERYQPVSYSLARSRSGTEAEFVAMVNRCTAVGVGIYVDAVINHMTNWPSPGTGSHGTAYTKYSYPGLYSPADFHPPCVVTDYSSAANVQDCELLALPDLRTEKPEVREKIAGYLAGLARLGVAGFRVDAAKHIQQADLDAIINRVNRQAQDEALPIPYWFLEVSGSQGEALQEQDYYGVGYSSGGAADITEFTFTGVASKFRQLNGEHLADLNPNGSPGHRFSAEAWGLMPGDKAVVFLQNHDTQHQCGLDYRTAQVYRLAHVWMLAQTYGYPSILSSYVYACPSQASLGPPSDPDGWTLPVACAASMETAAAGDWVCEHRDPYIRAMVHFRRVVAGAPMTHWWDNGADAIAFSRGGLGFVAINREAVPLTDSIPTNLPAGLYCDILTGGKGTGACIGSQVQVSAGSRVLLSLAANSAVAIDSSSFLSAHPIRGTGH
ncbi:MAG TPA: alpha-amylase family protein, partial [Gemmatimonadales bacterium]|nr:alpha-amylase family protein [Gemmatimonadales bacterium]